MKHFKQTLKLICFTLSVIPIWLFKSSPRTLKDWSILMNLVFINYFIFKLLFIPIVTPVFASMVDVKPVVLTKTEYVEVENEPEDPDVWVAWRISKAGLNPIEAIVVISKESGYDNNDNKFNINKNGTIDLSRWMINSIHYGKPWKHWLTGEEKVLTIECVASYKCATDWAISKRIKEGNWSAWFGARNAGIK